jgi:tyrosine-protein phosphatase YwqE
MEGFIDIHSHILPDMDDGSDSIEETMEILKTA